MARVVCTGRGGLDGGHCCWIDGEVCEFLFIDRGGTPRCGIWGEWDSEKWLTAPVGRWFAERCPGGDCSKWPQEIPEAMAAGSGVCCWSDS